jgi:hypothetical protein
MTALRRTTTLRGRPMKPHDHPGICEFCETSRAHGNHTRCSKLRQAMYAGQKENRS